MIIFSAIFMNLLQTAPYIIKHRCSKLLFIQAPFHNDRSRRSSLARPKAVKFQFSSVECSYDILDPKTHTVAPKESSIQDDFVEINALNHIKSTAIDFGSLQDDL